MLSPLSFWSRLLLLVVSLPMTACIYTSGTPGVMVSSWPAGAAIKVDGQKTGMTTPSMINLDGFLGSDHSLSLHKKGFKPAFRKVYHRTTAYTARWTQGATDLYMFSNPLFWTIGDFFTPFGVRWVYVPHELCVRLDPEQEAEPEAQPESQEATAGPTE